MVAEAILTPTETAVLWGLHHPYWLGAIAISLVVFLQLSISIVGQLLRHSLQWLGKSPFFLGRWLLTQTSLTSTDAQQDQQLVIILARLESLQQEQASLLAELQAALRGANE
ncbi:MAG: hypothetical protein ACFB2W_14770 [Leptolyngbyaceae cyanobacterium]